MSFARISSTYGAGAPYASKSEINRISPAQSSRFYIYPYCFIWVYDWNVPKQISL